MAPMILLRLMLARIGIHLPGLISLLWSLGKTVLPFVGKALLLVGRALMLNPIGAVLTLLAGAAYLIYENWDAVAGYFTSSWEEIKQSFAGGIGGVLAMITNFSPLGLLYQAFAGVMNYLGVDLPNRFIDAGGMMLDGLLAGLSSRMGALKDAISGMGDATIGWFKDKLGIHSPSRVFAELGGFTLQGLTQGLQREQAGPLAVITQLTRQMADAGALQGRAVKIDNRRPIVAASAPSVASNHRYEINIHPAPGMDPQAIARAVRAELARIDGEKQARQRSQLSDRE
jgi:hypothetical protein